MRECECAAPLPGIPPQPGQRGASPRGERHVTAEPRSPRLLPRFFFFLFFFRCFWAWSFGAVGVQEVLAEPCQRGERGGEEYGGSSGPPFAENRPSPWVGGAPSLLGLPARKGKVVLDSSVWNPFEVDQYQNPFEARMMACGHNPNAFFKTPPLLQSLVEADWLKPSKLGKLKGGA